jgi:hypothetical protein
MPRYYFDIHDGIVPVRDELGLQLDGVEAAQREAVRALPELAKDTQNNVVVEVRDEADNLVLRATLSIWVERLT